MIARTGGKKSFIRLRATGTVDEDILEALEANSSLVENILKKTIYK